MLGQCEFCGKEKEVGESTPLTLENPSPTKTEEQLYFHRGYYVIENSFCEVNSEQTPFPYIVYAICPNSSKYHQNVFPKQLTIDSESVCMNTTIKFRGLSEDVEVNGWLDMELLALIQKRIEELGWETLKNNDLRGDKKWHGTQQVNG